MSRNPKHYADLLEMVAKNLRQGCGNHGCRVNPPKGQATNASCKCRPSSVAGYLMTMAIDLEQITYWEVEV